MQTLKISPSNLGALAAPNYCPRCFWRVLKLDFHKPFSFPMPRIMNFLDEHQKQLAKVSIEENCELPGFFGRFHEACGILDLEWLEYTDEQTGILVRGKPDLLLKMRDQKIVVIDNKTAIHHGDDDVMYPRYRTQTNAYAAALMYGANPRKVGGVGLLHYEFDPLSDKEVLHHLDAKSVWARFRPRLVEVELDIERFINPYLKTFLEISRMKEVPQGRVGCADCALLDLYADLIAEGRVIDELRQTPKGLKHDRLSASLLYQRVTGADAYLLQHRDRLSLPLFPQDPHGLIANWDFSTD